MSRVPIIESRATDPAESVQHRRASRAWHVLHSCETVADIADLVEGQLAVGMRPSIATPEGFVISANVFPAHADTPRPPISLLNTWNEVRQWRKIIVEGDAHTECDLLHAHSFAAGMAGVRNCPITVYEISNFIENHAPKAPGDGVWLLRSFRVAEQFVISRAAAVVVRTESLRDAVVRRGAAAENVFVVPAPIAKDLIPEPLSQSDDAWLQSLDIDRWHRIIVHAPGWKMELAEDGTLAESSRGLLEAFAVASSEEEGAFLLVESDADARQAALELCEALEITARVRLVDDRDAPRALDAADIVIANGKTSSMTGSELARHAMLSGKTLLASDTPDNRDVTPAGRGCLWFRPADFKDVAHRLSFLARNRDFRLSLARSGQRFLLETCDPAAVAIEYDRVYQHAIARRKSGGLQTPVIHLSPASAML